ncbi:MULTISPECIES: ATP-binding protein [Streptomyces]|uniref:ATP-binding protein n=1 Tax=Streptomyces cacaoi TaxID=1898 RepID=A0A4Y3QY13_STRCI|nr:MULTISPECIES: ATP-binding protein [Streptomyces]NNG86466.1 ATP-binding protein [Streptomyces cacaoi]GEB49547.1 ATP-binding protein [Streptomyces cacaoi]
MQVLLEQLEIGPDPTEVGRARRWARARLHGAGVDVDEPLAETLILLISELVTNAVVHTGCPAVLCMLLPRRSPVPQPWPVVQSVRVEVADVSSRVPCRRQAEDEETNGRGLELVSCLADRWGWEQEPGGKRVWCELDAVRGEPGAARAPVAAGNGRSRSGCVRALEASRPGVARGVPELTTALTLSAFG